MNNIYSDSKTICALATSSGNGAIAVIRLSGEKAIEILSTVFHPIGKVSLSNTRSNSLRFGAIYKDANKSELLDEVLVSIFRTPHSYTGENAVEISCHGSDYIVQEILILLIANGATLAEPGEFTRRAFLNGKMDLAQAEAVADVIACETQAAHKVALNQLKGGFSQELSDMRQSLLDLVSLMELELDFSEEDVEFADRNQLKNLLEKVSKHIHGLIESFKLGNVIKNGVPVAIVGATNTGKSTLLNTILSEERAIVSNIHGTTRDSIEDTVNISGITFRFIDTAGIRTTLETIEIIGIERTYTKMRQASVIIMVLDAEHPEYFRESLSSLAVKLDPKEEKQIVILLNKADIADLKSEEKVNKLLSKIEQYSNEAEISPISILPISAKFKIGIEQLRTILVESQKGLKTTPNATLVTNIRHYEALQEALTSLNRVNKGIEDQIPTDLISQDIRQALYHIGSITGEISNNEVLGNIFSKFCIGK